MAIHQGHEAKQLRDNQGNLSSWYINYNLGKYMANAVFADNDTNNHNTNTTASDDGVYPADTFKICQTVMNNIADGSRKLRLSLNLPVGKYKARILYSPDNSFLLEKKYRVNSHYGASAGEAQLVRASVGTVSSMGKGSNQYNNEFEFTVPSKEGTDFAAQQEGSPTQNHRSGINLTELTKLS